MGESVMMKDARHLSTLEELQKLIHELPDRMLSEEVAVRDALLRVVSHDLFAPEDLPQFCRSLVDGYAIVAAETRGLTGSRPLELTLAGVIAKGAMARTQLSAGAAMRVAAGGMLPPGADAVVQAQAVEAVEEKAILVYHPITPGENVIPVGSDIKAGTLVFPRGYQLRPQDVGILAAIGIDQLYVLSKPKVGIVSIGDELVNVDADLKPGMIRDLNSYTLSSMVKCNGGIAICRGICPDNIPEIKDAILEALRENDLVLVSGASSRENRAIIVGILEEIGQLWCTEVALKPGQATAIARVGQKMVFCLPGHPVPAMIIFDVLVKPYLAKLMNRSGRAAFNLKARLSCNIRSLAGYDEFIRVRLEERAGEYWAIPIAGESLLISTLVQADGLIKIPYTKEIIEMGNLVDVIGLSGGYL